MLSLLLLAGAAFALNCTSNIARPVAKGVQITDLTASQIANFGSQGNDVCFFTVTLTHPGTGDSVKNLYTFPLNNYNGRFQGQGGGGWAAGNPLALAPAAAAGYAAGTTDAGHELSIAAAQNASWGLLSPGNVDQYGLLNFAHRSVHDMTVLGKSLANNFYGKPPCKSYWNGCSNGGRQGLQSAQLYPEDYDGILANAPAIQYTSLLTYGAWSWSVLTNAKYFPDLCELEHIGEAVVAACDELDGVKDGIISAPGLCTWHPRSILGQNYTCGGSSRKVSQQLVDVVEKVWDGPRTRGKFLWWGLLRGAGFTGVYMNKDTGSVENTPRPFTASDAWLKAFIAKDWSFNTSNIPLEAYGDLFLKAHLEYDSLIGTASPNLKPFKQRGGKIITWQGLADQLVNPQGTIQYYQGVEALDPSVHDFYRLYFSPGVGHCFGGTGVQPIDAVGQLVSWVENGTAPATLKASSTYGVGNGTRFMDLCPWPATQKYNGGDPNKASSYSCATQKGWLDFAGPNGRGYNFFTAPGWYGGDSSITASFP